MPYADGDCRPVQRMTLYTATLQTIPCADDNPLETHTNNDTPTDDWNENPLHSSWMPPVMTVLYERASPALHSADALTTP